MWTSAGVLLLLVFLSTRSINIKSNVIKDSLKNEHIIFHSKFNISRILATANFMTDSSETPTTFFTASERNSEGESYIYALEGYVAYEVIEGGTDITAAKGVNKPVYFGTNRGIYKYDRESLSAKKHDTYFDDIAQLQISNDSDTIYILTTNHKMYKILKDGTERAKVEKVVCALEFVLDNFDNIYYIDCYDKLPHIVTANGKHTETYSSLRREFEYFKMLRPASIMDDDAVPILADGSFYILHSNGSVFVKDFHIEERPSAISIDVSLYLVIAMNGNIYEYNVMDTMIQTMFSIREGLPNDITTLIFSLVDEK